MDLLIAFSVFIAAIVIATVLGVATYIPMLFGYVVFFAVALWRRCPVRSILSATWNGVRGSAKIITIVLLVGVLTALWRMSGVIAFFVYYGVKLIAPPMFILLAFSLALLMAYALGSTVGVVSTVGIIFMTIARSGSVNLFWTAGAILSGSFLGERCSPTSSCQNLISGLCQVELYAHVRLLLRNGIVPLLLSAVLYGIASFVNPLQSVDTQILTTTAAEFQISPWLLAPMLLMLVLPLLKIDVRWAILSSSAAAGLLAVFLQKQSLLAVLEAAVVGYHVGADMNPLWNGGGILSMASIVAVFILACIFSKIFEAANMLHSLQAVVNLSLNRLGRTVTVVVLSIVFCGLFCTGTTAAILAILLLREPFAQHGYTKLELSQDMGTLLVSLAPLVPWCVANTMAFELFGLPSRAIFYVAQPLISCVYYIVRNHLGRKNVLCAKPVAHS